MEGVEGATVTVVGFEVLYVIRPVPDVFVMAGKFTFFELENVIGDTMESVLGSNIEFIVMPVPNRVILNPVPVLMAVIILIFGTFGVVQVNVAVISFAPTKTDSVGLRTIVPQTIPIISKDVFVAVLGA